MGMNIKDPEVHAMARELAARRITTITDAVRLKSKSSGFASQAAGAGAAPSLRRALLA